MMLKELFRFLPMLEWGTARVVDVDDRGSREQIAINTCLSTVQTYFPCDSSTPNPACLCEQYAWRVACYDNHASIPSSYLARATAETELNAYCRAAGDIDILRQNPVQRRQLDSIFASIGGDIISFFKPPTPDATSAAAPTLAPVVSTPKASAAPSTRVPASTAAAPVSTVRSSAPAASVSVPVSSRPTPSTLATQVTQAVTYTSSQASAASAQTESASPSSSASPTAAPPASSGPSTGLIVGVVFGILLSLAAIGILVMLVLRHRRQSNAAAHDAATAEDRKGITQASRSEGSMETVRTEGHGMGEKGVYYGHEAGTGLGIATVGAGSARGSGRGSRRESVGPIAHAAPPIHVAEIDGREVEAPIELEARTPLPDCLRAGRGGA